VAERKGFDDLASITGAAVQSNDRWLLQDVDAVTDVKERRIVHSEARKAMGTSGLDPLKVIVSDAAGHADTSNVSTTELSYLSGATSSIQTQLGNKQAANANLTAEASLTGAADQQPYYTGVGAKALYTVASWFRSNVAALVDLAAAYTLLGRGSANGLASLDSGGKVPTSQLPDAILGAMSYQGTWNATTNSPTIPTAASGNKGHYYKVGTAGTTTIDGISEWAVGDWLVSNGTAWDKVDNTEAVSSVAGRTGAITLTSADVGLSNVANVDQQNADNLTSGTVAVARLPAGTSANQIVKLDGDAKLPAIDGSQLTNLPGGSGTGDVVGPASATDGNFPQFDTTTGKLIKNSSYGPSSFQAADAELAAIAGLTSAADKGIQFTGDGTAATFDLTAAGKALLDDADAAAQKTTLGLHAVASSGAYGDLSGTPSLAAVATSGAYGDLSGKPSLATVATSGAYSDLTGSPTLANVATSGSYSDLSGSPSLAAVATSGNYGDLSGSPALAAVATSGSYPDLTGSPTLGSVAALNIDTDGTLAANSDSLIPTQKAVKTYADQLIASADAMVFQGVLDCSANPNYPAADAGDTYKVSVAGKIGGGSGPNVEIGDLLLCTVDATSSGNHATVGANWAISQVNIDGAVTGPSSATDSVFPQFDGTTGRLIKNSTYGPASFAAALGSDDNYVTDAEKTKLSNLSGTNTGDQTSVTGNAGTATALQTGRTIDGVTFDGTGNITVIAPATHAATSKATPVDADELPLVDSAASNVLKRLTWANLKATLKTYFDTLYALATHTHAASDIASGTLDPSRLQPMRRKNINGDMRIDQQFAGGPSNALATLTYPIDQWCYVTTQSAKFNAGRNLGAGSSAVGFPNYLGFLSTSSFSGASTDTFSLFTDIEGYDVADLAWGTADAKTVTLSFWVYSSQTGTFGGSLQNSAGNRSYPFSFTISSADTWERKTITIAGDTSGTWLATNGIGLALQFDLGCGSNFAGTAATWAGADYRTVSGATKIVATNNATFRITGVQLEEGSLASPYERRTFSAEFIQTQRYYRKSYALGTAVGSAPGAGNNSIKYAHATGISACTFPFGGSMRAAPTVVVYDGAGASNKTNYFTGSWNSNGTVAASIGFESAAYIDVSITSATFSNYDFTASARMR
jgi:hypothetical protein